MSGPLSSAYMAPIPCSKTLLAVNNPEEDSEEGLAPKSLSNAAKITRQASVQRGTHHDHGWCQAPSEHNLGVRLGRVTVTWRARIGATAEEPEDESRTRRAVADWPIAANAIANKVTDPHVAKPLYVV